MNDLNGSGEDAPASPGARSLKRRLVQDLSYLVLVAYAFFIVAPVVPLVADVVAHTFWEKEHLSTAHHQFGEDHVSFELMKAEKQTDKESTTNSQKAGLDDLVHRAESDVIFNLLPVTATKRSYSLFNFSFPVSCSDIDYPPPRV